MAIRVKLVPATDTIRVRRHVSEIGVIGALRTVKVQRRLIADPRIVVLIIEIIIHVRRITQSAKLECIAASTSGRGKRPRVIAAASAHLPILHKIRRCILLHAAGIVEDKHQVGLGRSARCCERTVGNLSGLCPQINDCGGHTKNRKGNCARKK